VNELRTGILALNSGSSSLKFGLFASAGAADEQLLLTGSADESHGAHAALHLRSADGTLQRHKEIGSQAEALETLAASAQQMHAAPVAVGHRIVHGGPHLREHCLLTPQVLEQLEAAVHFAPLHLPAALALLQEAQRIFPRATHFVCFDTAFHSTMPEVATRLPLPRRYSEQGVIRYGFHGLSYESIVHRLGVSIPPRMVAAHLGSGASLCAIENGRSIDTSMGLTPTGGIPMGTRTGDLDPGVLLFLLRTEQLTASGLEALVNSEGGLAGYSGGVSDVQRLLQRATAHDEAAALAIHAFCTAVRKQIGAYAALLGGIDLLVFTGGIGEHSEPIRNRICHGLDDLGVTGDKVRVMRTEEELQIARHGRRLLAPHAQRAGQSPA
jgi:acetate kinase